MMNREEAVKILGLNSNSNSNDFLINYTRMYNANAIENKGSPYIRSELKNALEF